MPRIYHNHDDREECEPAAMWRVVSQRERDAFAATAADLMAFPQSFEAAMVAALDEWPRSCEHNLSASSMNQRAWLGHAGCFLATGSPEDATRQGWRTLTAAQQFEANAAADRAIAEWRRRQRYRILGGQLTLDGFAREDGESVA